MHVLYINGLSSSNLYGISKSNLYIVSRTDYINLLNTLIAYTINTAGANGS